MSAGRELLFDLGKHLDEINEATGARYRDALRRRWLKIRDKGGALVPFELNRAQREYDQRCGRQNIVLKARQLGITTHIAARFFLQTITRPGTLTVQVAHDQRSAEHIFRIVHRFLANLKDDVREELKVRRANVRQILFGALDSEYRVETAGDAHAGRGSTIHNLHCSEVAMWPGDARATLAALRAAVPPHGEIVLESTPRGAFGCFYEEWQQAEATGYVRHFFPWWWEPKYRKGAATGELTEEERELVARHGLDLEQIAFRREVHANFGACALEEFAEDAQTCFRTSGDCFFETELVEQRLAEVCEPCERRDNDRLHVWLPYIRGRRYIVGVDPAGGGRDGDLACAQVVDRETGMQCAELLGHLRPEELARAVAELGRMYGGASVAVERNNHGHAVLAFLGTQERYEPLYREGGRRSGEAGWLTTAANRPTVLENLAAILRHRPESVQSRRLLEQCRTFVRGEQGRPEAANGCHDDALMAMAIAQAVRAEGR